jgi:hypothetical protein
MRKLLGWMTALACLSLGGAAQAQAQASAPAAQIAQPVTYEGYYRIKWGQMKRFKELYERNHAPLLRELQRQGLITSIKMEEPSLHMAGGPRWDLRVTLVFRDPEVAIGIGGTYDEAWEAAQKKLFPDKAKLDADENERFSLLEEHWDVLVIASGP